MPRGPAAARERSHALTSRGDIAPTLTPAGVRAFSVEEATKGKQEAEIAAMGAILEGPPELSPECDSIKAILDGASPDDATLLRTALEAADSAANDGAGSPSPLAKEDRVPRRERGQLTTSDELADDWRRGYPYKYKMLRRDYEAQKFVLQTELLKMQAWVKGTSQRLVILFEGRDAAGKGGAIKRFMEHLNPRGARVVALEKPSEVERGQWDFRATCSICRRPAKSCCSIAAGTIAPGSST